MKRLQLTPELIAQIKEAVGQDVDVTDEFAVFENISLNTLPLPGKDGTVFEKARVSLLTLRQMVDSINGGNHLPLIHDHDMKSIPVGRVFKAGLTLDDAGGAELRTLFYIDPTEQRLAAKVDAGSLDEVSVQFLASQMLCSECDFDYRGEEADWSHFSRRTCENGHSIGHSGVHIRLVGLAAFTELSLVTRGAANNPKIVGRSQSKLAAPLKALAARGFEVDRLFLTATKGEFEVDLNAVLSKYTELSETAAGTKAELGVANAALTASQARVAELEASLAAATASPDAAAIAAAKAEAEAATASLAEATEFLSSVFVKLATAAGEADVTAPETITELKSGIEQHQASLTAILPIGGVAASTQTDAGQGAKFNASAASAFIVR